MTRRELEERIGELPRGYISRKTIRGKQYCYLQWKEQGKIMSRYLHAEEIDEVEAQVEERRKLEAELRDLRLRDRLLRYKSGIATGNPVSIGMQDYEAMILGRRFYVDKTRFIADWWRQGDAVTLITRPRRFGKTLNLSMLRAFFSLEYAGREELFRDMEIRADAEVFALQGSYPVIALTFGDMKAWDRDSFIAMMKDTLHRCCMDCCKSMDSARLAEAELRQMARITGEMDEVTAVRSLQILSSLMHSYYGKKVIILMDEYDTPLLEAYTGGYREEATAFLRAMLNSTFKANPHLERAVLTGITRVSRESFFSDLNHLRVCGMTSELYRDAFGFTEEEVFGAMRDQGLAEFEEVKRWYDGFRVGSREDIYNPWSITNYLAERKFKPYWVHTGSNQPVLELFRRSNGTVKTVLQQLLMGEAVTVPMEEEVSLEEMERSEGALWGMLVASGYLKPAGEADADGRIPVKIVNTEVREMFRRMIPTWFAPAENSYHEFLQALLAGDAEYMTRSLMRILKQCCSFFDTSGGEEPERFYHGLILGLLVSLGDRYVVTSNRESGMGRYDVQLKALDRKSAILMEFKVKRRKETLAESAEDALTQIRSREYAAGLQAEGIPADRIRCYGLAFSGKEALVVEESGESCYNDPV